MCIATHVGRLVGRVVCRRTQRHLYSHMYEHVHDMSGDIRMDMYMDMCINVSPFGRAVGYGPYIQHTQIPKWTRKTIPRDMCHVHRHAYGHLHGNMCVKMWKMTATRGSPTAHGLPH